VRGCHPYRIESLDNTRQHYNAQLVILPGFSISVSSSDSTELNFPSSISERELVTLPFRMKSARADTWHLVARSVPDNLYDKYRKLGVT
jgi:hypothetical protein